MFNPLHADKTSMGTYLYHVNSFTFHALESSMIIGRTSGDLVFGDDPSMSGKHVELTFEAPDKVWVEDLKSKNHTVVDRIEIPAHEKTQLKFHSLLEVGGQRFILFESQEVSAETIDEILKVKDASPVRKLQSRPIGARQQLHTETLQLGVKERELRRKIKMMEDMKAAALREYHEKTDGLQVEIQALADEVKQLVHQIEDNKRKMEKMTASGQEKHPLTNITIKYKN